MPISVLVGCPFPFLSNARTSRHCSQTKPVLVVFTDYQKVWIIRYVRVMVEVFCLSSVQCVRGLLSIFYSIHRGLWLLSVSGWCTHIMWNSESLFTTVPLQKELHAGLSSPPLYMIMSYKTEGWTGDWQYFSEAGCCWTLVSSRICNSQSASDKLAPLYPCVQASVGKFVTYVLADHVWSSQTRNVFALILCYCARDIEGSLLDGKKAFGRTFYSLLIETLLLHVIHCNVAQNVICGRIK